MKWNLLLVALAWISTSAYCDEFDDFANDLYDSFEQQDDGEMADTEFYRGYACHDAWTEANEAYVFIVIFAKTFGDERTPARGGVVSVGDALYIAQASQEGLDYRVDFTSEEQEERYSIIVQNDGDASFYDFGSKEAKENDGYTTPSRRLECGIRERPKSVVSREVGDPESLSDYKAAIRQKIESNWSVPAGADTGFPCTVRIRQTSSGDVTSVSVDSCSRYPDDAVLRSIEAAIYRSSPLPLPSAPSLFDEDLLLNFSPHYR